MTSAIHYVLRPATSRRVGARAASALKQAQSPRGCRSGQLSRYSTATSPASKPLQFYTAGTPNGRKVSILLEELQEQYGLKYELVLGFEVMRTTVLTSH